MIGYQQEQRSLTKEQKEAVGLLSIGTFLELVRKLKLRYDEVNKVLLVRSIKE